MSDSTKSPTPPEPVTDVSGRTPEEIAALLRNGQLDDLLRGGREPKGERHDVRCLRHPDLRRTT